MILISVAPICGLKRRLLVHAPCLPPSPPDKSVRFPAPLHPSLSCFLSSSVCRSGNSSFAVPLVPRTLCVPSCLVNPNRSIEVVPPLPAAPVVGWEWRTFPTPACLPPCPHARECKCPTGMWMDPEENNKGFVLLNEVVCLAKEKGYHVSCRKRLLKAKSLMPTPTICSVGTHPQEPPFGGKTAG